MITSFISVLWLGILTSISPCPLATNIAAVSYISKRITHPVKVVFHGVFYAVGRMTTYFLLGTIITFSMVSVSTLAIGLQSIANKILGIVLIIVGLFLFDIFKINLKFLSISQQKQQKLLESGFGGAFLLGVIFALSFCPISAALFFGSVIPITLKTRYMIGIPLIYGFGTALPVVFFSILISMGTEFVAHYFNIGEFKIKNLIFIICLILTLSNPLIAYKNKSYGNAIVSKVISVYDGDTFRAECFI